MPKVPVCQRSHVKKTEAIRAKLGEPHGFSSCALIGSSGLLRGARRCVHVREEDLGAGAGLCEPAAVEVASACTTHRAPIDQSHANACKVTRGGAGMHRVISLPHHLSPCNSQAPPPEQQLAQAKCETHTARALREHLPGHALARTKTKTATR